jgi:hypothetical protein
MVEEEYHSILLGIKVKGLSNSELNKPKKCTCSNILGKYFWKFQKVNIILTVLKLKSSNNYEENNIKLKTCIRYY